MATATLTNMGTWEEMKIDAIAEQEQRRRAEQDAADRSLKAHLWIQLQTIDMDAAMIIQREAEGRALGDNEGIPLFTDIDAAIIDSDGDAEPMTVAEFMNRYDRD